VTVHYLTYVTTADLILALTLAENVFWKLWVQIGDRAVSLSLQTVLEEVRLRR